MKTEQKTPIRIVPHQPPHVDQHEVQEVNGTALHYPVNPGGEVVEGANCAWLQGSAQPRLKEWSHWALGVGDFFQPVEHSRFGASIPH